MRLNDLQFDAFVCLNGRLPKIIRKLNKGEIIIAADGAFDKLLNIKIISDVVIGDFDSLIFENSSHYDKTIFIKDECQETNDFEKILNYCQHNKYNKLLIFGLNGGQLEHTLNNLSVLKKFNSLLNLTIYDRKRIGKLINEQIEINCRINEIVSIIPFEKAKLKTANLRWELNNEWLALGKREGARNQSIGSYVKIEILDGEALIFWDFK